MRFQEEFVGVAGVDGEEFEAFEECLGIGGFVEDAKLKSSQVRSRLR